MRSGVSSSEPTAMISAFIDNHFNLERFVGCKLGEEILRSRHWCLCGLMFSADYSERSPSEGGAGKSGYATGDQIELAEEGQAADIPIQSEESVGSGNDCAA